MTGALKLSPAIYIYSIYNCSFRMPHCHFSSSSCIFSPSIFGKCEHVSRGYSPASGTASTGFLTCICATRSPPSCPYVRTSVDQAHPSYYTLFACSPLRCIRPCTQQVCALGGKSDTQASFLQSARPYNPSSPQPLFSFTPSLNSVFVFTFIVIIWMSALHHTLSCHQV